MACSVGVSALGKLICNPPPGATPVVGGGVPTGVVAVIATMWCRAVTSGWKVPLIAIGDGVVSIAASIICSRWSRLSDVRVTVTVAIDPPFVRCGPQAEVDFGHTSPLGLGFPFNAYLA